jgi:hypothetical protein
VTLPHGLRARLELLYPGATIERVTALADDESGGEVMKALGYGRPLRIDLAHGTARPDDFGHDRRADRVANLVLAYDTFGKLPNHVAAIDVGLVRDDGSLVSLTGTGEPDLLTSWAAGELYADELRRIAASGTASDRELAHAERLAELLLEIHGAPGSHAGAYTRAITFGALLASIMVSRPVRDALALEGNPDQIPWLFTGTFAVFVLVVPVWGAAVTKQPRRLVPIAFHVFAACALAFFAAMR